MSLARINLLLALLVAFLALLVLLWPAPALDPPPAVTGLDPTRVRRLRIERPGSPTQVFERRNTDWYRTAPQAGAADSQRLDQLVRIATAPSRRRLSADAADPAELGLAPPLVTLTLDHTRLELGTTEPVNHRRYLRVANRVHLVDDRFLHLLPALPARRGDHAETGHRAANPSPVPDETEPGQ